MRKLLSKGIAFTIVAYVLIAILGILILMAILNIMLPEFVGRTFCKFYLTILTLPIPSFLQPTIPGCSLIPSTERIEIPNRENTTEILTHYLKECWRKSDLGKKGQTFTCYEIFVNDFLYPLNETDVTSLLKRQNYCSTLSNNHLDVEDVDYDCGNKNQILWKVDTTGGNDLTIFIKYNAYDHRLDVSINYH